MRVGIKTSRECGREKEFLYGCVIINSKNEKAVFKKGIVLLVR